MPLLLEEILGDRALPDFLREHYLQEPLARSGAASRLRTLATWELVDRLVGTPACDLMLVRDGALWPGPRPATAAEARALHADGYTLVLRQADRHDPALAELGRALSSELQGTINLQIYCTPGGHGSFGWHCDPEEVFIFQTAGAKQYLMRRNTLHPVPLLETLPPGTDASLERTPVLGCRLEAGDWLYIPGGYWHMASAPEESISISVGLMPATPLHVLEFLRAQLLGSPAWRRRLPPLGHASALSDEERIGLCRTLFRELGDELKRQLDSPAFALRFLGAWATLGLRSSSLAGGPGAPGGAAPDHGPEDAADRLSAPRSAGTAHPPGTARRSRSTT